MRRTRVNEIRPGLKPAASVARVIKALITNDFTLDVAHGDLLLFNATINLPAPGLWGLYCDGSMETHDIASSCNGMAEPGLLSSAGPVLTVKLKEIADQSSPSHRERQAMTNPFEDPDGTYLALINDEGQYSLWPAFIDVPAGWRIAHPQDTLQACTDYINEHWTDMRPQSLIDAMNEQ
jgi:MbtH protein